MKNPLEPKRLEVFTISNLLAVSVLCLPVVLGMTNWVIACGDDPAFRITTKHDRDKVKIAAEEDRVVIEVQSPKGISQAVVERSDDQWPASVMLRLHLKGLERLQVINGKRMLEASVSSQDGQRRISKDDSPLDAKHPSWMDIRMLDKDGEPVRRIPLNEGYFEMQLPKALLDDNPKSITLKWIDFYR
ncbi:hypothetical protein [Rhodopirellula baltica]